MGTPAQRLESERAKYPAMQVDEILVWRNFLVQHQAEYTSWDYNYRLGANLDPGPDFPDFVRKSAIATRALRIDAVGYSGAGATLFEVKRVAGPANVGQLLTYAAMWAGQNLQPANPRLALVASGITQLIMPVVQQSGITIFIVPTDFSFLSPIAARRRSS